jgi:phospholipid/cholesterol/gamma-HCH transport system substrate-binding protein
MGKGTFNNIRLGLFVLAGLLLLVFTLYMLGKEKNLFGSTFTLKAQFENVNGLKSGNNVRFSGIEVGTVKKVVIICDTLIEVTMIIDTKVKGFIQKNAQVSIGTEGLMGNRVLNIIPVHERSTPVESGDLLATKKSTDIESMLHTLGYTNKNIATVSDEMKMTIQRINNSKALWSLLNDTSLTTNLRNSLINLRVASARAGEFTGKLNDIASDVKNGKGTIGKLIKDSALALNLYETADLLKQTGEKANVLTDKLVALSESVKSDIEQGKGTANLLLKDSSFANKLSETIGNIEKASEGLNQNMEALKHNFLFRGYFRKLEKQKSRN